MKTVAFLISIIALTACSAPPEATQEGAPATGQYGSAYDVHGSGGSGDSKCFTGVSHLVETDAGTIVEYTPVACRFGWIDPSDPGPEKAKKDLIDPAPETQVRTQAQ